ncbi:MAG: creatininase family protein [Candidatus Zipacnadales bacterium]
MPKWGRYEELRPAQIAAIIQETGIAYLPWGALEWHGPHAAIGLDALKIHHLALRCAELTGGVVLPVVYAGYQTMKPHAGFKYTIEVPAEVIHGLVNAYLDQLADEGFRLVVLMMGHYGGEHVKNIHFAIENWPRYRDPGTGMRIWAFPEPEVIAEDGYRGDHAGAYETSLLMYFRNDLVDLTALPTEEELDWKALGIGGEDPRTKASSDYGRQLCEILVKRITEGVVRRLNE